MKSTIKRHGGKFYLAKKIIGLMPPRCLNSNKPVKGDPGWLHYVEPYGGSGAVLFNLDSECISRVFNDLDGELTNFWDVLKNEALFCEFSRQVSATPVSQIAYERAESKNGDDSVLRAVDFFVRNRQSRQALEKDFATLTRNRCRRGMNELASAWLSSIEGLTEVHEFLKSVVILNDDALNVIQQQDGPRTLFYLDPPYTHDTRSTVGEYGQYEMDWSQHFELLSLLSGIKGKFLLSGYHNKLYDENAIRFGWRCNEFEIDNKASSAKVKKKKIECVWTNY